MPKSVAFELPSPIFLFYTVTCRRGVEHKRLRVIEPYIIPCDYNTATYHYNPDIYQCRLKPLEITHTSSNSAARHAIQTIQPSIEEKVNYIVQEGDSLAVIGKKTGHPWLEIFKLNKTLLKNDPDKIYPGQALLVTENHEHADLINHATVQQRIQENLAKQHPVHANVSTNALTMSR